MYQNSSYNDRGRFRGRGGRGGYRGGSYNSPQPRRAPSVPIRKVTDGIVGRSIDTLSIPATNNILNADITNVDYIGSYNWTDSRSPTIIVPGSPPEWLNKPTPFNVQEDTAEVFVDQNGFHMPTSTLLPLIACVDQQASESGTPFDWSSIDVVTDRNGLRKLLRWIRGKADNEFRIDVQLAGKTLLLSRWESRVKDFPLYTGTFGHNFEEATTRIAKGCDHSTGHHRVVKYNFGGLKMVVRSETDAFIPSTTTTTRGINTPSSTLAAALRAPPASQSQQGQPRTITMARGGDVDVLVSAMSSVAIADKSSKTVSDGATRLIIQTGGTVVPQQSIAELKSVSQKKFMDGRYDWDEVTLQLLIGQAHNLLLGVHQQGYFSQVKRDVITTSPDILVAKERVKPSFVKLRQLLGDIKELLVRKGSGEQLSLIYRNGQLEVFKRSGTGGDLPADFLNKFSQ